MELLSESVDLATPLLRMALAYAGRGWRVHPVHSVTSGACSCGKAACASPGKHPRLTDWPNQATTEPSQISRWWTAWPDAHIGIATGSGLLVIDADAARGGLESLAELVAEFQIPPTAAVLTGGGGRHLFLAAPAQTRNRANFRPGLDVRGDGGFVVAPPSGHVSGSRYRWDPQARLSVVGIADAPAGLLAALSGDSGQVVPFPQRGGEKIGAGERNNRLASLAGRMRRFGLDQSALEAALLAENRAKCEPPLNTEEVLTIARSVARYAPDPHAEADEAFKERKRQQIEDYEGGIRLRVQLTTPRVWYLTLPGVPGPVKLTMAQLESWPSVRRQARDQHVASPTWNPPSKEEWTVKLDRLVAEAEQIQPGAGFTEVERFYDILQTFADDSGETPEAISQHRVFHNPQTDEYLFRGVDLLKRCEASGVKNLTTNLVAEIVRDLGGQSVVRRVERHNTKLLSIPGRRFRDLLDASTGNENDAVEKGAE